MNLLNGFFSEWFYGPWFDFNTYNVLLGCLDSNNDYVKIMGSLILITVVCLLIFYKYYDPINNGKWKWAITILLICILCYGASDLILWGNGCILIAVGNFNEQGVEPTSFIRQINIITVFYSLILSIILSLLVFRKISNNNRKNPF